MLEGTPSHQGVSSSAAVGDKSQRQQKVFTTSTGGVGCMRKNSGSLDDDASHTDEDKCDGVDEDCGDDDHRNPCTEPHQRLSDFTHFLTGLVPQRRRFESYGDDTNSDDSDDDDDDTGILFDPTTSNVSEQHMRIMR